MRNVVLITACSAALLLAPAARSDGQARAARDALLAAKRAAADAAIRNDRPALRDAIADLDRQASDAAVGPRALYHAGWSRWMLAASELLEGDSADAMSTLERALADLGRAAGARPDDADTEALLAWVLTAVTSIAPARRRELGSRIAAHRRRALALAPDNPRVMIMDAGLTFFTPPHFGGSQARGLSRWLEAMRAFEAERVEDPVEPDWGRDLAYGWLANLYLAATPPDPSEARRSAERALALRPDFWFVTTQVLPRLP